MAKGIRGEFPATWGVMKKAGSPRPATEASANTPDDEIHQVRAFLHHPRAGVVAKTEESAEEKIARSRAARVR